MEFCRSGDLAAHLSQLKSTDELIEEHKGNILFPSFVCAPARMQETKEGAWGGGG
jgi:hypothetical protein